MAIIRSFTSRAPAPGPIPGAVETAGAPGRAVQRFAQGVGDLADILATRQKQLDEERAQVELSKFDADLQAKRTELLLASETEGEPDGLAQRNLDSFNSYVSERRAGLDELPRIRNRVSLNIESHQKAFETRLLGVENTRRTALVKKGLDDSLTTLEMVAFRDPSAVEAIKARGWDAIEAQAATAGIAPEKVLDEQEKFTAQVYTAAVRGLIAENPPQALGDLSAGKYDEFLIDVDLVRKLTDEADRATRVQEAERRRAESAAKNRFTALMRDDLVSLESTGVGIDNIEAQAASILDETEYGEFIAQRDLAKEQHARLKEIEFSSRREIVSILNHAAPEPGTEGYADNFRKFEQSQAAAARVLKERESDPAGFAMRAPEIADGFMLAGDTESPELFQRALRARYDFQVDMGVRAPRVLSNQESTGLADTINNAKPMDRAAVMAGMQQTYGPMFDIAVREMAADGKIEGMTKHLVDFLGDPIVSGKLAQAMELGTPELRKSVGKSDMADITSVLGEQIAPFQRAFEGADPTGGAARAFNDIRAMIEAVALVNYRRSGNASEAAEQAYQEIIGKNFELLETSRVSAYMPRVVEGQIVSAGQVEDVADFLITRERIEAFDPDPMSSGLEGEVPEVARARVISTAVNSGVWVTNARADGLVLMLPLVGGGMLPLINRQGMPYELKFSDASRIAASMPTMDMEVSP